jgi:chitinase
MTTERLRLWSSAWFLALGITLACGDSGGDDEAAEGSTCEPGSMIDCACTDGSMATQTCNAEGSGYDACACEDAETGDDQNSGSETAETTEGPMGEAPVPEIFHPGDGETRAVDVPIPWIGVATDAEDGDLTGMSMVWSSDLDGQFGTGEMFDAPLTTVGMHVISLTATDSDGQQGVATIQLMIE